MTTNGQAPQVIDSFTEGSYRFELLGYNNLPSFVHIDNYITKTNSVIVPIEALQRIFNLAAKLQH